MEFVFGADVGAQADDKDVAEAGCGRNDPNKDPQHNVGQQVLKRRDAISVGLAAAHVRGIPTVLELLEVAEITDRKKESQVKKKRGKSDQLQLRVGYTFTILFCTKTEVKERFRFN